MAELEKHRLNSYHEISSPHPLGVTMINNGIRFAVEVASPKDSGLVLRGNKKEKKIAFCEEQRCGSISYGYYQLEQGERYDTYQIYEKKRRYLDEYVRQVQGNEVWGKELIAEKSSAEKELQFSLAGKLEDSFFEWKESKREPLAYSDSILYCLHVRGFTKHSSSKVKGKGTFLGITEKIPYLKELGITTLELMPCYEFEEVQKEETSFYSMEYMKQHLGDEIEPEKKGKKLNYWGYKKGYYFSPKASYSYSDDAASELKEMIQSIHKNGMEVIMQFYFPKEIRQGFLLEVVKYWVLEYHIDGVHILGEEIPVELLETDPLLSGTKLLFEQGFLTRLEQGMGAGLRGREKAYKNLAFCQEQFMYVMRRYLKGDDDMLPTFLEQMKSNPGYYAPVNYITNYTGFTLQDVVSYDKKHNEENGEENRDGNDYNFSWNCGVEGATRRKNILKLRKKQVKNAMIFLLTAQGTPRILSGDEFLNSQNGNNNAYCQDNEVSWINWDKQKKNMFFWNFVKELILLRKNHPILHPSKEFQLMDTHSCGYPDLSYHGEEAWRPNLDNYNRHVAMMYCGKYAKLEGGIEDNFFYLAFNMHWMPHSFALPKIQGNYEWRLLIDTEKESGFLETEDEDRRLKSQQKVIVEARSVKIYIGVKLKK